MRTGNSTVLGPSASNLLGDDSTAPAGDFTMSTHRPGKGFPLDVRGTGRGDVTKHLSSTDGTSAGILYTGSHGCPSLTNPKEWETFAELVNMNREKYRKNFVKIRVQYAIRIPNPKAEPQGSRGGGKNDPPLIPVAIPLGRPTK